MSVYIGEEIRETEVNHVAKKIDSDEFIFKLQISKNGFIDDIVHEEILVDYSKEDIEMYASDLMESLEDLNYHNASLWIYQWIPETEEFEGEWDMLD